MLVDYFRQGNVGHGVSDVSVIDAVDLPYYKAKIDLLPVSANYCMVVAKFAAGEWSLPVWVLELLCLGAHTTLTPCKSFVRRVGRVRCRFAHCFVKWA